MIGAILLVLVALITACVILWPKPPLPPSAVNSVSDIDSYLLQLTKNGMPPGISIAVVKDGTMVYNKGIGYADGPLKKEAGTDSTYHWWSTTKIVTAMAVMQLQERGKLAIDDPVERYLPWFQVVAADGGHSSVTIRQLLNHSSGLSDLNPMDLFRRVHGYNQPPLNQTEFVKQILPAYNQLAYVPGAQSTYSNLGYMVLGAVIESASGQTYETFVTENILQPLEMNHTGFVYSPEMLATAASGSHPLLNALTPLIPLMLPDWRSFVRESDGSHIWFNITYTDYTPPTGLIGPAAEAAQILNVFLNQGEYKGLQILLPESIAEMIQNPIPGKGNGPAMLHPGLRHGLGWWVMDCGGQPCLEHTGEGPGFGAAFRIYPEKHLGIVVLTNDMTSDHDRIMDVLVTWDWNKK